MRLIPVVAATAIGLVASLSFASAQTTQTSPRSGTAPTVSNSTQQGAMAKPMQTSKKMKATKKMKTSKKM
jgi:hypothetical protein